MLGMRDLFDNGKSETSSIQAPPASHHPTDDEIIKAIDRGKLDPFMLGPPGMRDFFGKGNSETSSTRPTTSTPAPPAMPHSITTAVDRWAPWTAPPTPWTTPTPPPWTAPTAPPTAAPTAPPTL